MPDSRHDLKPHKIRFRISGGLEDVLEAEELLRDAYSEDWEVNFYEKKSRGDFGPLHDISIGFIQSL